MEARARPICPLFVPSFLCSHPLVFSQYNRLTARTPLAAETKERCAVRCSYREKVVILVFINPMKAELEGRHGVPQTKEKFLSLRSHQTPPRETFR